MIFPSIINKIYIGAQNEYSYNIIWNIDRADEIIQRGNVPIVDYPIEKHKCYFENTILDPVKLILAEENKSPVIFANYSVLGRDILIDGNHRFKKALLNNQKTIPAYIFTVKQSVESMLDETFKTIYKMHHN